MVFCDPGKKEQMSLSQHNLGLKILPKRLGFLLGLERVAFLETSPKFQ